MHISCETRRCIRRFWPSGNRRFLGGRSFLCHNGILVNRLADKKKPRRSGASSLHQQGLQGESDLATATGPATQNQFNSSHAPRRSAVSVLLTISWHHRAGLQKAPAAPHR